MWRAHDPDAGECFYFAGSRASEPALSVNALREPEKATTKAALENVNLRMRGIATRRHASAQGLKGTKGQSNLPRSASDLSKVVLQGIKMLSRKAV